MSVELQRDFQKVLKFWYGSHPRDGNAPIELVKFWFQGGAAVDEQVKEQFQPLIDVVAKNTEPTDSQSLLASVITLDQFPRSVYRQSAKAFAYDSRAQDLVLGGIKNGLDKELKLLEKHFFYMPLMHSESLENHKLMVNICKEIMMEYPDENVAKHLLSFEMSHFETIEKFGRYPYRNQVLGRTSTPEEIEYLKTAETYGQ